MCAQTCLRIPALDRNVCGCCDAPVLKVRQLIWIRAKKISRNNKTEKKILLLSFHYNFLGERWDRRTGWGIEKFVFNYVV